MAAGDIQWENQVSDEPIITDLGLFLQDRIYTADRDQTVYNIDPEDGSVTWQTSVGPSEDTNDRWASGILDEDGNFAWGTQNKTAVVLDSSGDIRGELELDGSADDSSAVTLQDGSFAVGTVEDGVVRFDKDANKLGQVESAETNAGMAVDGSDYIFAPGETGNTDPYGVHKVDIFDEQEVWVALEDRFFFDSHPVLSPDGVLYIADRSGNVHAIEDQGSTYSIQYSESVFGNEDATPLSADFDREELYVGSRNSGVMYALDMSTGSELWNRDITGGSEDLNSVASVGESLLYVGGAGELLALSKDSGEVVWDVDLERSGGGKSDAVWCSPAISRNSIYVATRAGYVFGIDIGADTPKYNLSDANARPWYFERYRNGSTSFQNRTLLLSEQLGILGGGSDTEGENAVLYGPEAAAASRGVTEGDNVIVSDEDLGQG